MRCRGRNGSGRTLLQRIQMDDIAVDTLPQLLRMEDRSSMAFSLEARVPLLDHKVVELGVSLPDHLKVNRGWSKFAVRQAMAGMIPDAVRLRTTKLGFAAPDRPWLGRRPPRARIHGVAADRFALPPIRRRDGAAPVARLSGVAERQRRIIQWAIPSTLAGDVDAGIHLPDH